MNGEKNLKKQTNSKNHEPDKGEIKRLKKQALVFIDQRFELAKFNMFLHRLNHAKSIIMLHLIPMQDVEQEVSHDIIEIKSHRSQLKLLNVESPISGQFVTNLNGYSLKFNGNLTGGFTHVFRDGTIESIADLHIYPGNIIMTTVFTKRILSAIESHIDFLNNIGATTPVLFQISLLGISGSKLVSNILHNQILELEYGKREYISNELRLIPGIIHDFEKSDCIHQQLVKQMNYIWNAYGYDKCWYVDDQNEFNFELTNPF